VWPSLREFLLPVAIALWMQVDVWGSAPFAFGHMVGPRVVVGLLYAGTSLALAWRRIAPMAVLTFVVTADSAEYLAFGAPEALGAILPLFVAFYAVGRYTRAGTVAVAAPLVLLGLAVHELRDPTFELSGSAAFYWLVLSGGWPLGVAFRRLGTETDALAAQARQLAEDGERAARAAAVAERARIARELHDVVGHGLSIIVLQLVAALETLEKGNAAAVEERLLATERSARDALAEMRRLLDLLDDGEDTSLSPQPGLGDLQRLLADTRAAGAEVRLRMTGSTELPPGLGLAVFRILQESLTNVLRHARPPRAEVLVDVGPDAIELDVHDAGEQQSDGNPAGRGLAGMRERAGLYGGELRVGPDPAGGYRVHARLPVPR
jgi:signal transduction histidine kinase